MSHPLARKDDLIIKDMDSEMVVFDAQNNQVHALSPLSRRVWQLCDGMRSIREIAIAAILPLETVELALAQLSERDLLAERLPSAPTAKTNRRRSLAVAAAAAVAVPMILSVTAPRANALASVEKI